ncbi:protein translocase subunit SecA 1, partial [Striga asiatica]
MRGFSARADGSEGRDEGKETKEKWLLLLGDILKSDIKRNVLKSGQFEEWLRGSFGGFYEPRERRSSSPLSERAKSGSSKARATVGGEMQPRVTPGIIEPQQFAEPVMGGSDKSKGVEQGSKSLEVVSSNNELESSKGKDMGDKKLASSSFVPMDLDGSKAQELDFSNLVNVPVGQIQQQVPVSKSQKSFVRITKSKIDPGVEQGVGLTGLSTSATSLHTGDDRVRRQTREMASEVHRWQYSGMKSFDEELKVELWIQIHKLPLHWIFEETGKKIGRIFDEVLDVVIPGDAGYNRNMVRILVALNLLEPIPRGTKIKLGKEEQWVEFRYEHLLTFCFYCGCIGHHDRICEVKKSDIKRKLKSGQFREWLRGSFGGFSEPRERNSSSPLSERAKLESSKARATVGGEMQPRVTPGIIEPQQFAEPVMGGSDKSKGVEEGSKSLEVVSSNNELESSKGKDMGDKKLASSSLVPMDLNGSKAQELDFSNLVNVPVGQIQQQVPAPKSQKSFVRITKSKIVESKNNTSDKQIAFCEPQSDKANLKWKTIIDPQ